MESGLYLVSTPIGNLGDVSRRALEILGSADVVFAEDTRRTGILLKEFGLENDLRSFHEHNEARRTEEVLARLAREEVVVLATDAGTPAVSDPGRRAVEAALAAEHRVVPVPGPSAVVAALSVSGLPAERFAFLGFPPRGGSEREAWMDRVEHLPLTTVVFESPRRLSRLLAEWEERGLGERSCVLARELTKKFEEVRRATVAQLRASYEGREVLGEVTLVLEGASPEGWEASREEVDRTVRSMVLEGRSTRDITRRLQEEYGVPRNEAYQMALEAERGDSG